MLREFEERDWGAFAAYQSDPRYMALYDLDAGDAERARSLFDLFVGWQAANPRTNLQLGIFDRQTGELLRLGRPS
jgi:hypothetical protein